MLPAPELGIPCLPSIAGASCRSYLHAMPCFACRSSVSYDAGPFAALDAYSRLHQQPDLGTAATDPSTNSSQIPSLNFLTELPARKPSCTRGSAWLGNSERRGAKAERRGVKAERRGAKAERRGAKAERRGAKVESREVKARRGVKAERRGVKAERRGVKAERRGVKAERRGVKAERRGVKAERRGVKAERRGVKAERRGVKAERRGVRGEESKLRGEESKLRGEESKLRGEESKLRGEESKLIGEESNLFREESKGLRRVNYLFCSGQTSIAIMAVRPDVLFNRMAGDDRDITAVPLLTHDCLSQDLHVKPPLSTHGTTPTTQNHDDWISFQEAAKVLELAAGCAVAAVNQIGIGDCDVKAELGTLKARVLAELPALLAVSTSPHLSYEAQAEAKAAAGSEAESEAVPHRAGATGPLAAATDASLPPEQQLEGACTTCNEDSLLLEGSCQSTAKRFSSTHSLLLKQPVPPHHAQEAAAPATAAHLPSAIPANPPIARKRLRSLPLEPLKGLYKPSPSQRPQHKRLFWMQQQSLPTIAFFPPTPVAAAAASVVCSNEGLRAPLSPEATASRHFPLLPAQPAQQRHLPPLRQKQLPGKPGARWRVESYGGRTGMISSSSSPDDSPTRCPHNGRMDSRTEPLHTLDGCHCNPCWPLPRASVSQRDAGVSQLTAVRPHLAASEIAARILEARRVAECTPEGQQHFVAAGVHDMVACSGKIIPAPASLACPVLIPEETCFPALHALSPRPIAHNQ
ncbi:unnamed protein product [Closterium sp. NIES-65]|nr:unnamed protein product [Closterium sp. NIES-65]